MTPRKVKLRLGKMTYTVMTPLSDAALVRVQDILDLVSLQSDPSMGQENMLLLACLHLAYALDATSERLDGILQKLELALDNKGNQEA